MKESKKSFILEALGSLFSNDKAISCSKKSPVWLTILLFFIAVIVPVIPLTVTTANGYGSSFITNYSACAEKTMPVLALQMAKDNVNFLTIDENHEVNITENDSAASYKYENQNNGIVEMEVFFSAATNATARSAFINSVADHQIVLGTNDKGETTYYHSSYIVFFKNAIYCCIYQPNSTTALTNSAVGDYKTLPVGTNLIELLTTVDGAKITPASDAEINAKIADSKVNAALLNNWKTLFNKSYETLKVKNTWQGSLIYLGIYAALSLIMGLLIWVMCRGKNNPFNYLSLWACIKIEAWASVAPGLIGLVLGFFLTQYAMMIFIMCLGMRVMWISMKQLRPEVQ